MPQRKWRTAPPSPRPAPVFNHVDRGTPEPTWQPWLEARPLEILPLSGVRRLLAIAAHPDDETLGAGGLLATASALDIDCAVLLLTDGEGARGGVPDARLGAERRTEFEAALSRLSMGRPVHSLALQIPDGEVAAAAARLELIMASMLDGFDLCVGPWEADGHPDHDAAGAIARRVAFVRGIPYYAYPIWYWHWGTPSDESPMAGALRFPLDPVASNRKALALADYRSQRSGLEPILSDFTLAYFQRDFEVFVA
jgi:LmbE family N-acetylglucosaminyl deacetylase